MFPSLLLRRALLPLGLAFSLAACADQPAPLDPRPPGENPDEVALQALSCTVDVRGYAVSCAPDPDPVDAAPDGLGRIILNPVGYINLTSSNPTQTGETLTFDVTVQNLAPQTLSVSATGRYDGAGVRVFFSQLPVATQGTGTIVVNDAEVGKFTRAGQLFYRYPQPLATGQTSSPRRWSLTVPGTVTRFSFSVLVAASVQNPHGTLEILGGPTLRVALGGTLAPGLLVRDALGRDITASVGAITLALADSSLATISGSTVTGGTISGVTTLYATSGRRTASVLLVVGTPFTRIDRGWDHACGLLQSGEAYCWGNGNRGELGTGAREIQAYPAPVQQRDIRYTRISAGTQFTCALSTEGRAYCWGLAGEGQLGDGAPHKLSTTPTGVRQRTLRFVEITAGRLHACALTAAGQAYCWGNNHYGQIGDGGTTPRYTPAAVHQGTKTFAGISAGVQHTCALTAAGEAWCWGFNRFGEVGDGTQAQRDTPVQVHSPGTTYVRLEAGSGRTCGVTAQGLAYCWGANFWGALGEGTTTHRSVPTRVHQGTTPYARIALGVGHTCGLTAAGQAYCWGLNDWFQLGDGTRTNRLTPVPVLQGSKTYVEITAGSRTCGLAASGQHYCW